MVPVKMPVRKTIFTIKEVAESVNVHQQTLRNWEKNGLIMPERAGMRRIYTANQVELCRQIREFSGKGVPLKGLREIIKNTPTRGK